MTHTKCPAQSFHVEKYHKGRYFVGCNYYGMIIDSGRCEKCGIKNILKTEAPERKEVLDMAYSHECPICGANLDPGEKCDCKESKKAKEGSSKNDNGTENK